MKIILASKSPRRKEILSSLGIKFDILVSDVNEDCDSQNPAELVSILSERKGLDVAKRLIPTKEKLLVISSDTVVAAAGRIFGKPSDERDAEYMIKALAGKTHSVFSGISLITLSESGEIKCFTDFEETLVSFKNMSDEEISLYLSMENVLDKAGAYAIQGAASLWIDKINGNYFNVVGLPINKLVSLSEKAGISIKDLIKGDSK